MTAKSILIALLVVGIALIAAPHTADAFVASISSYSHAADIALATMIAAPQAPIQTPMLLRFEHLKERGVVTNWPQLKRLVEEHGFPPGRYLSKQVRVWTDAEIAEWVESRPTAGKAA